MVTTFWLRISTNPHFSADLFIFTKKRSQTCQVSRFHRESPAFDRSLQVSWFAKFFSRYYLSQNNLRLGNYLSYFSERITMMSQYRICCVIRFGNYFHTCCLPFIQQASLPSKLSLNMLLKFRNRNFQDYLFPKLIDQGINFKKKKEKKDSVFLKN